MKNLVRNLYHKDDGNQSPPSVVSKQARIFLISAKGTNPYLRRLLGDFR